MAIRVWSGDRQTGTISIEGNQPVFAGDEGSLRNLYDYYREFSGKEGEEVLRLMTERMKGWNHAEPVRGDQQEQADPQVDALASMLLGEEQGARPAPLGPSPEVHVPPLLEDGASFGMVGDEWIGDEPPGPGWVMVRVGERGGKHWKQQAHQAAPVAAAPRKINRAAPAPRATQPVQLASKASRSSKTAFEVSDSVAGFKGKDENPEEYLAPARSAHENARKANEATKSGDPSLAAEYHKDAAMDHDDAADAHDLYSGPGNPVSHLHVEAAKTHRKASRTHRDAARADRLALESASAVPGPSAQPQMPSLLQGEENFDLEAHLPRLVEAIRAGGEHNIASLVGVRQRLAGLSRAQQDKLIDEAMRQGIVSGSVYEGRHGIGPEEREAGIRRPNEQGVIGFLHLREQEPSQQPTAASAKPWKRPKTGKSSGTVFDTWALPDLIRRRGELQRSVSQLQSTAEGPGLTAETARHNLRTLQLELAQVESAFEYARVRDGL